MPAYRDGHVADQNLLQWPTDPQTAKAAKEYPLLLRASSPSKQFGEDRLNSGFNPRSWDSRIIQPSSWPKGLCSCTPNDVINQFKDKHYTQGLAMVACWGLMWRQPNAIWGTRTVESIHKALADCDLSIQRSRSIEDAWDTLTGVGDRKMGWTSVITSKTLHFLCRSLGFERNPPVAIDGRVVRDTVWPIFKNSIPMADRPEGWAGHTYKAYCRYMTAIRVWADARGWTTKEIECTIFSEYS